MRRSTPLGRLLAMPKEDGTPLVECIVDDPGGGWIAFVLVIAALLLGALAVTRSVTP